MIEKYFKGKKYSEFYDEDLLPILRDLAPEYGIDPDKITEEDSERVADYIAGDLGNIETRNYMREELGRFHISHKPVSEVTEDTYKELIEKNLKSFLEDYGKPEVTLGPDDDYDLGELLGVKQAIKEEGYRKVMIIEGLIRLFVAGIPVLLVIGIIVVFIKFIIQIFSWIF